MTDLIRCTNPIHDRERVQRLATVSGMTPDEASRRLKDIRPMTGNQAMLGAARKILNEPYGWLYIWGGPGNAKSEVLKALVNELRAAGWSPAMYVTLSRLIEWMRDSFTERKAREKDPETDLGYIQRFDKLLTVKALAIDEMDKARDTEFAADFRFHFLDRRYQQGVSGETVTIFAANTPPAQLPEPIYDRIRDGRFVIVENKAGSARPNMRRPK